MPGPTTEVLNSDLKELRDVVHALEVAMERGFGRLDARIGQVEAESRAAVERGFGDVRGEMDRRFDHLETRMDHHAAVTRWAMTVIAPAVVGLFGFLIAGAWYAGGKFERIDVRIERLESRPGPPTAGAR